MSDNATKNIIQIAGMCGLCLAAVFFMTIAIPLSQAPWFDWTKNAISDLGVEGTATAVFNYGMILSGVLAFVFSLGLVLTLTYKTGPVLFTLSSIGLIGIGLFPETYPFAHLFATIAFFLLLIGSFVIIGATLISKTKRTLDWKMGMFALAVAVVSICSSALLLLWTGIAVPEVIVCFSAFAWCFVHGLFWVVTIK